MDIPALTYGVDVGPDPTPFEQAQQLAAEAWGARRAWFLINGASQGNLAAGLALAHRGTDVVVQRNAHSSTIDSLVLSGLRPTFAAPEIDAELGVAHCLTPETLDEALERTPERRRRVGDLPDLLRRRRRHPLARRGRARARRAAHRRRGVGRAHGLPRAPARACALGGRRPGDLQHAQDRRQPDAVGDAPPRARSGGAHRRGHRRPGGHPDRVHEPELAAARLARRRAPPGRGARPRAARAHDGRARRGPRAKSPTSTGLDVLDDRLAGRPGVFAYDPLRLAVDVRGIAASGYEIAPMLREIDDINLELYGQNVLVAVFGMGERRLPEADAAGRGAACRGRPRRAGTRGQPRRASPRRRRGANWR